MQFVIMFGLLFTIACSDTPLENIVEITEPTVVKAEYVEPSCGGKDQFPCDKKGDTNSLVD